MKKMIVMSVALLGLFFGGMALNSANANTNANACCDANAACCPASPCCK